MPVTFSPEALAPLLQHAPPLRVAYSGGLDSHVLLHALASLGPPGLRAVHVHHGLSPRAGDWAAHCLDTCRALGVPCSVMEVDARPAPGQSPEAAAREARYRALAGVVGEGEWLLTAQHRDDQAETLLLQLLRGAGPRGLAGMPERRPLGRGWLVRPLLPFGRDELRAYAESAGLRWVEDESNADTGIDRNYLRHRVLPLLAERWPAVGERLGLSAAHCAEALELLGDLAAHDAQGAVTAEGALRVAAIAPLSPARRRNLLRHWILRQGAPLPPAARLESLCGQALAAGADRGPRVAWAQVEVRRHRDALHLLPSLPAPPEPGWCARWDGAEPLPLPGGAGRLESQQAVGGGIARARLEGRTMTVQFRQGGERCRPVAGAHHRSLKQLLQEAGVPPWERERLPLVWVDGELAAVADRWVCAPFAAGPGEAALHLRWARGWVSGNGGGRL